MSIVRHGFFAFLEDVSAPGSGFSLYGGLHLAVLAVFALVAAAMCASYTRLGPRGRLMMLRGTALVIFALEAAKQLTFPLIHGHYWIDQLTLHLCGLNIFVCLVHVYFPNRTTGEILYSLGLPGAFAALMFPNWTMYPIANFYCLQSFIIHILQFTFVLMLLFSGELRPKAKNLWRVAVFLVAIVPPIYLLNLRLGTNFFFVNAGSEGSPLEIFVRMFGSPGFLIPYLGLVAVVWFILYLPWELFSHRRKCYDYSR